jgi:two-component system chemotaxis response regulator CheB
MGGVETISGLLAALPADFAASVLIVQHTSPGRDSHLASLFARSCRLPVADAKDREELLPGRVYVAVPDRHLTISDSVIRVGAGPQENRTRPAIDPLFRSAAVYGRERTIGVILSGLLDDGSSGLEMIKRCGGLAVVQKPEDALFSEMPSRALASTSPDYVVALSALGPLLERLITEEPPAPPPVPPDILAEVRLTERALEPNAHSEDVVTAQQFGELVPVSCPACGGPLWKIGKEDRYRCNVGHTFALGSLLREQDRALEESLWEAIRTLEERGRMLTSLGQQAERMGGSSDSAERYTSRAEEAKIHAARLRQVLLTLQN